MYENKKILVVGVARSGIAVANLLNEVGAIVTINDIKNEEHLKESLRLLNDGIKVILESKADELVKENNVVVVSPGIPLSLSFVQVAKNLNIPVIGEIEVAYNFCSAKITAITGTNGKTTTTALLGEIFKKANKTTYVAGNIGDAFSNCAMQTKKEDAVALEVSSFQLETIEKFKPKVSAVLNITPDHLERHKTMENYIDAKERIFENQTDDDVLVLNYDNEYTKSMGEKANCKVVYFSKNELTFENCVFVKNENIIISDKGKEIFVCKTNEVSLPGKHNLENILSCVAMAYYYGIDVKDITYIIKNFSGVEHRLEFVCEQNGIRYINDSKATNVDAALCAIKAMDRPTIIILGGYDKGATFEELIMGFTENIVGAVVLGDTKELIVKELNAHKFNDFKIVDSFEEGIVAAKDMSHKGYNVLLSPACASFDMFGNFEKRGHAFKKIVKKLTEE